MAGSIENIYPTGEDAIQYCRDVLGPFGVPGGALCKRNYWWSGSLRPNLIYRIILFHVNQLGPNIHLWASRKIDVIVEQWLLAQMDLCITEDSSDAIWTDKDGR